MNRSQIKSFIYQAHFKFILLLFYCLYGRFIIIILFQTNFSCMFSQTIILYTFLQRFFIALENL